MMFISGTDGFGGGGQSDAGYELRVPVEADADGDTKFRVQVAGECGGGSRAGP